MPSVKGKIYRDIVSKAANFNPYHTSDVIGRMKKISQKLVNDSCPEGFILKREQTPAGTKFERVQKPDAPRSDRLILYFHGGAYIGGLFGAYRNFTEDFCNASESTEVIYLDYHTAPESLYPVQLGEALDLWHDLTERQGYDPKNIIIGGDSAGANLLLALMLKLRDDGKILPRGAFCISAWADMTGSGQSFYDNYGKDVMFGDAGQTMDEAKKAFLLQGDMYCCFGDEDRTNPYISPVYGEYHGFPPMLFIAGGDEMLLSDTLTITQKLRKENIPVLCEIQPGMFHVYAAMRKLTQESDHSWNRLLKFIRILYFRPAGRES